MDYQRARVDHRRMVIGAQVQAGVGQTTWYIEYDTTAINWINNHGDELSVLLTDEWVHSIVWSFERRSCPTTSRREHRKEGVV
jgi:hypothetical protein